MSGTPLTRRHFIASTVAGAAWLAIPGPLKAQTPPRRPIIGTGEHTYECFHDWLVPPSNIVWGDTHGLAVDRRGHLYVSHTVGPTSQSPDAILEFDPDGKFVRSWGAEFKGGGHGLDLRREDGVEFLYHCDIAHRKVVKTTLTGEKIWEKGVPTESGVYPSEDKWCPTNVAFHPEGDLYVGDGYGSSYIHRYTKNGDYKGIVVKPGTEAGFVQTPHGLWVDTRGKEPKLVVADRGNHRLQEFTLDGQHISLITEGMRQPCHIHYNHGLALVPDLDSIVTILGPDNKVVAGLGDGAPEDLRNAPREKFHPGKFVHPHAAIWMNKKDILVVEWVPIGRVTKLRRV